jgi:serine kinase of HPr protein (carbohydrate metabolism regulator)
VDAVASDGPSAGVPATRLVHGTCLEIGGCGVLILGAPGSGKSDVSLRLIDQPGRGTGLETMTARLVADDQVVITRRGATLFAAPPARLAGLIEVRGLGIVAADHAPEAELGLAVRLADATGIERLPEDGNSLVLLGIAIPEIAVDAAAASAPARIRAGVMEVVRARAARRPAE